MSDKSAIEWCDATWNPIIGCSKVSEGCRGCYAIRSVHRMAGNPVFGERYQGLTRVVGGSLNWTGEVRLIPEVVTRPLEWKRPRRIFVNSQSDLFHETLPDEAIFVIFGVMAATPRHTYQVLTKRPERMREFLTHPHRSEAIRTCPEATGAWPLPNVWLGTSTEDQATADERIAWLLKTPAAVRFLSCEPLLGPIDLAPWLEPVRYVDDFQGDVIGEIDEPLLDWVITGGESGPNYRPMDLDWARSLRDQCQAAGVPYFFKQVGGRTPKANGRLLDGVEWSQFPEPARAPIAV